MRVIYEVGGNVLCYTLLDSTPSDITITTGNNLKIPVVGHLQMTHYQDSRSILRECSRSRKMISREVLSCDGWFQEMSLLALKSSKSSAHKIVYLLRG